MRFLRRAILILVLVALALPAAYGLAALLLGLLPAPHRAPLPDQARIPIYLISNGWHVWLALPMGQEAGRPGEGTWENWLGDQAPRAEENTADYVAFGWGDRDFYLKTRRPADLRPDLAFAALLGRGPAAMHVMRIRQPTTRPDNPGQDRIRQLDIDPLQYHALAAYIRSGFAADSGGRPRRIPGASFSGHDAFYEATGRYSPIRTCNEWIGAGLRAAGLPAGWWTPFPFGLMGGG
ncbi:TIGR02117 family protein [Ferrovibrio sp.]|uniref:TIGR02117 family protein n=1 Tax=Ferrovibrio sp. TaxID=1917215 RepID=UPI002622CCCB|nr:TIGR02117 family protein [Ferrovibrio sp.]